MIGLDPTAKHVVISGGSRGLGQALALGLLDAGYRISTFSRKVSEFVQHQEKNPNFFFTIADLADAASVSSFLKSAEAAFGSPYALINCAATGADGLLATMPDDVLQNVVAVNLVGTLRLTKLAVRRMLLRKGGGVILNISSISAFRGYRGLSAYGLTKAGLDAMTRSLARELGKQGIRVNSVTPGFLETEMTRGLNGTQREQILRRTPLGRLGRPEDVVGAVRFFLSDQSSFITGQVLVIDGGNTV